MSWSAPRILCLITFLGALSAHASGQVLVTPSTQMLLLQKGRIAVVTVRADGCASVFTPSTSNPSGFELGPVPTSPSMARSITVKALGNPGAFGVLRMDVLPIDGSCGPSATAVVSLFIVGDERKLERSFLAGDTKQNPSLVGAAGHLRQMRKDLAQIFATHALVLGTLVKQQKNGVVTLPPNYPPGPGGSEVPPAPPGVGYEMTPSEMVLAGLGMAEATALARVEDAYWTALARMATDGAELLKQQGFLGNAAFVAPVSFHPNRGGLWDRQVALAHSALQGAVRRLSIMSTHVQRVLQKQSIQRGETLIVVSTGVSFPDPGMGSVSPITGIMVDRLENLQPVILQGRASNGPTSGGFDTSNGRLQILGRVKELNVAVQVRKLDAFGTPTGNTFLSLVTSDPATHLFSAFWPKPDDASTLAPGTWHVTVSELDTGFNATGRVAQLDLVVPMR